MPYCPQCGTEISGGRFCPQRGVSSLSGERPREEVDDAIIPTFKGSYARFWTRNARGRAGRTEFWNVALAQLLIFLPWLTYFVAYFWLREILRVNLDDVAHIIYAVLTLVSMIYAILTFARCVFLFVRRLHDVGLSGWFWPLALLPFVGAIFVLIVLFVRRLYGFGLSGWFWPIALLPFVGAIFVLIVGLLPSENKDNRFGKKPSVREIKE
ncbi:MAG: DUF805 domain-containing protein [Thermoguttaceae bacterium]|nr:DUF805 domain-containing protein [Thermoguttaceae bacterium]